MNNSVRDLVEHNAATRGDSVFLIDGETGEAINYEQLRIAASNIATAIDGAGVAPGQSVAFAMPNSAHCAISLLGILYGGYRATAINLVAGKSTIAYVLKHSESALILSQASQSGLLHDAFALNSAAIPVLDIDADLFDGDIYAQNRSQDVPALPQVGPDDDGLLMYTSGTTGTPKGVVLSNRNLAAGGNNTCLAHELDEHDVALCVLPLYHINGLCVTLMGPLVSGGTVVIPGKFSASRFWGWVNRYKCTWFSVVPTQISYLLHADESSDEPKKDNTTVRFGRSASAPLSPDVQRAFEQRFGIAIVETMGLTETAAQILSNPLPPGTRKIGSPGIPFGDEVIIADANQDELPAGTEGELLVRGDNVMKGYFRNPEVTAETITKDGWLRTGDLGRKDQDGYLFITGRLKELIIKGGENIAPREVDEALYHHPAVIEAAAFACPCENYGQRVEAAVSVDDKSELTEQALLDYCENLLGSFKTPDRIHFLEELPKGPSGKIQRIKLVELFVNQA